MPRFRRLSLLLFLPAGIGLADVPTVEQDCQYFTSATCEVNGVTFQKPGPCDPGTRTIHPPRDYDCADAARDPEAYFHYKQAAQQAEGQPARAITEGTGEPDTSFSPHSPGLLAYVAL